MSVYVNNNSINVGNAFIKTDRIGIGTIDTTARNAGVGTATGTMVFNATTNALQLYGGNIFGWIDVATLFSATGGTEDTTS